jgi:hypothetical protein
MTDGLTGKELELARQRIRNWPTADRVELTDLTEPEAEAIVLLTALLNIKPVDKIPDGTINIP